MILFRALLLSAALAAPGFGPDQTIDGMDIAKIRARAAEQERSEEFPDRRPGPNAGP